MALAILEFIAFEKGGARFRIDTGTNSYYRIKVGKSFSETNGLMKCHTPQPCVMKDVENIF